MTPQRTSSQPAQNKTQNHHTTNNHNNINDYPAPPKSYIDPQDKHIWHSKYCILEDGILYFYKNAEIAESYEAMLERRYEYNLLNYGSGEEEGDIVLGDEFIFPANNGNATNNNVKGGGEVVKILATVEAHSICDRVDFYFASNVSPNTPVSWKLITIVAPEVPAGESSNRIVTTPYKKNPNIQYTLPPCFSSDGCQHAVRVVLRSGRDPDDPNSTRCRGRTDGDKGKPSSNCPDGVYDDIDGKVIFIRLLLFLVHQYNIIGILRTTIQLSLSLVSYSPFLF